ncbi:conserved membrane hypothetical protein [uncultured delta proteobacterium]|uniref:Major facilitator superfamily (MFS) profile domain-containing protein n=1 Tax=uncultured delta proteobacterium TaxID=34034 RepID=A0A212J3J0_9DELT|nr:conserved membrane hypothetical protein [uncultured delta proteobacterium]
MPLSDKRHIIIFALITAFCLFGAAMLYIVLPVHYEEAGLASLWEVGAVLAVNRIVRLPLNPCIGFFYRHISERTGILIAVVLAIATTTSYGVIDSFGGWILARCVWGVAWALLRLGSLFCILRLATPANRGHMTGLYNGLFRLGNLVGMLTGGILADMVGIRVTACIFASAGLVALFLTLFYIPKSLPDDRECGSDISLRSGFTLIANDRGLLRLIVSGGIVALALQGVVASTLSRLIEVHTGGTVSFLGFLLGAATVSGFFQALRWAWEPWLAPLVGRMADSRYGGQRMLGAALFGGALFFAALAAPLPLALWFCCILGFQLSATALTTLADTAASGSASAKGGRAVLMHYALMTDVGSALGPLIAYGMNAFLGINAVYMLCAALFAVLAFLWRNSR